MAKEMKPSQFSLGKYRMNTSVLLVMFTLQGVVPMLPEAFAFQSTPLWVRHRSPLMGPRAPYFPSSSSRGRSVSHNIRFASLTNTTASYSWSPLPAPAVVTSQIRDLAPVVFNMVKALSGTGMLALPMGLAVITDRPSGLWAATGLIGALGCLSMYTFLLYARLIHDTQARSLGDLWKRIMCQPSSTTGVKPRDTSWVVSLANFVFCFGCNLAYSLVLGDIFTSLLYSKLPPGAALPKWLLSRQAVILGITSTVLLPLSNLQSLAALAPVSIIGVAGTLFTTAFLGFRCPSIISSSPYAGWGSFGTYSRFASLAPLLLVAMSCVAMMGHFSAPEFYHSMPKPKSTTTSTIDAPTSSPNRKTLRNFAAVTAVSFGAIGLMNSLTLAFGFLTFGGSCNGNILTNFAHTDVGAQLCRLLIGISVIGSFPMAIQPCRSAFLELLRVQPTLRNQRRALGALVAILTSIALAVKDVGFIIGLNGAVMGSNLMYTIPCLLFLKKTSGTTGRRLRWERKFCRLLIGFGVTSAIAGAWVSIASAFFPHMLT